MRLIPLNGAEKGDFYPEKQICGDWENKVQVIAEKSTEGKNGFGIGSMSNLC